MQKKIKQIKDITTIEGELNDASVGVIAFRNDDNVIQRTKTFIYLDKNIYIFFGNGDEEFRKIKYGRSSSFTILKHFDTSESIQMFRVLSISISGKIKQIEDQKFFDEIFKNYIKKYKWKKSDLTGITGSVMIDTEEIQAFEESGE